MLSLDRLSEKDLDVLVLIGAGSGESLPPYRALPVRRILVTEPNPECRAPLKRLTRKDDRITLHPWAVSGAAPADADATLQVWNNTRFNSLHPIPRPHSVLPGLRQTGTPSVDVRGIETLLDTGDLNAAGPSVLVLEALGETRAIMQRLLDLSRLDVFAHILFQAPQDDLFGTGETAGDILDLLLAAGFDLVEQHDIGFGLVATHVIQTPRFAELRNLKSALQTAQQTAQDAAAAQDSAKQALQGQLEQMEARAKKAEGAFQQRDSRLKDVEAKLKTTQDTAQQTAQDAAQKAAQAEAETEATLTALRAEIDAQQARAKKAEGAFQQRDDRLKEVEAELKTTRETAQETARAEAAAQTSAKQALQGQLEQMEARAKKAEDALQQHDDTLKTVTAELKTAQDAAAAQTSAKQALQDQLEQMEARAKKAEGAYQQHDGRLKDVEAKLKTAQDTAQKTAQDTAQKTAQAEAETEATLTALRAEIDAQKARARKAEGAYQQHDDRLKEVEAELKTTQETARETARAEAAAQDSAKQALQDQLEQMEARAKKAEGAYHQRDDRLREVEAELQTTQETTRETARAEAAAQDSAKKALQDQLEQMEARAKKAEGAYQQRDDRLREIEEKLDRKEAEFGIALRGHAALQADLIHLREQYETLRTEKGTTDTLLVQVTARLSTAAHHLHLLSHTAEDSPRSTPQSELEAAPDQIKTKTTRTRKPAPRKTPAATTATKTATKAGAKTATKAGAPKTTAKTAPSKTKTPASKTTASKTPASKTTARKTRKAGS